MDTRRHASDPANQRHRPAPCEHLDEVPEKLLEVRSELTGYRAHFATFKAELHNVDRRPQPRAAAQSVSGIAGNGKRSE